MQIETRYNYEKIWHVTKTEDLLKIIAQEVGDADPKGTLLYIENAIKNGKEILIGTCRFRKGK